MEFVQLQSLSSWVEAGGPMDVAHGIVLAALIFPLMVLVHEAGHAAVGLLRTEGLVVIRVGRSPGWVHGRIGRLSFELSPMRSRDRLAGWARTFARMTRGEVIAYAVAGSAAQLVTLVVSVLFIARTSGAVHGALVWAWAVCFLEVVLNLVPMSVGEHASDGAFLFAALRARPVERSHRPPTESTVDAFMQEFSDTQSRWFALVTDEKAAFRTERRGATLVAAAWAVGVEREKSAQVRTAFWHAIAGWCWRESERGDPERCRYVVDRAWRRTAQDGLVGRELDAAVAAALAADADLGVGSPGTTDDERKGFLARAFTELHPPAESGALDERDRLFCFRYGVALNDVERFCD